MTRRRITNTKGGATWMETYCDLITLLLTFFVMLYAMSTIDTEKFSMIVDAFSKNKKVEVTQSISTPGTLTSEQTEDAAIDNLYSTLAEYVKKENIDNSVEITKSKEYVFIRFSDDISFDGYSDKLNANGMKILDVLSGGLGEADEYIEEVLIAGHTAEVENDNRTIDRTLSTARANSVLLYLEVKNVIKPSKYLAIGYGLYKPIADNSTAEGRAKNRRVEIYISRKGHSIDYTNFINNAINNNTPVN